MPLTALQRAVVVLLATNRDQSSYLAGGAAQHASPNSVRFSYDLDYFHDSIERVASSFEADVSVLVAEGYRFEVELSQPGFIRGRVDADGDSTLIEWSHDTAWRFFPTVADPVVGFRLHEVDLAVNKMLALVGRHETRDLVDAVAVHVEVLELGALLWAAAGKDPGYTPFLLLERLRRRRAPQSEELDRLNLAQPLDPLTLKQSWLEALDEAEQFIESRPADEIGCLYWDIEAAAPTAIGLERSSVVPHFGQLFGVVPIVG